MGAQARVFHTASVASRFRIGRSLRYRSAVTRGQVTREIPGRGVEGLRTPGHGALGFQRLRAVSLSYERVLAQLARDAKYSVGSIGSIGCFLRPGGFIVREIRKSGRSGGTPIAAMLASERC